MSKAAHETLRPLPGAKQDKNEHGNQADDPMLMPFHAEPVMMAAGEVPVEVNDDPENQDGWRRIFAHEDEASRHDSARRCERDGPSCYFFGCAVGGKILFSRKYIAAAA